MSPRVHRAQMILVCLADCGLFQGYKQLLFRQQILGAVVLTHAHINHNAYLPAFVHDRFRGHTSCSAGTCDLCKIALPDSRSPPQGILAGCQEPGAALRFPRHPERAKHL